jgi:hypothetical protein
MGQRRSSGGSALVWLLVLALAAVLSATACASSSSPEIETSAGTGATGAAGDTVDAASASERGSWAMAARRLTIPIFRPTRTQGLTLGFVNPIFGDPGCEPGREHMRALYYGATPGRTLEIFEGHPRYCLDQPIEAPVLRTVRIRGATATLYDICTIRDCEPGFAARVLDWCEQGTSIQLLGVGLSGNRLIAIARGMKEVRPRPARRCVSPVA